MTEPVFERPVRWARGLVTEVRAGEGTTALLMAYSCIKPVREALILARPDGAEYKVYMAGATAVLVRGSSHTVGQPDLGTDAKTSSMEVDDGLASRRPEISVAKEQFQTSQSAILSHKCRRRQGSKAIPIDQY